MTNDLVIDFDENKGDATDYIKSAAKQAKKERGEQVKSYLNFAADEAEKKRKQQEKEQKEIQKKQKAVKDKELQEKISGEFFTKDHKQLNKMRDKIGKLETEIASGKLDPEKIVKYQKIIDTKKGVITNTQKRFKDHYIKTSKEKMSDIDNALNSENVTEKQKKDLRKQRDELFKEMQLIGGIATAEEKSPEKEELIKQRSSDVIDFDETEDNKITNEMVDNGELPEEEREDQSQKVDVDEKAREINKQYKEGNISKEDAITQIKDLKDLNTGTSIVDNLKSKGIDSSYGNRSKLAKALGIENYKGSYDQNVQMLEKVKSMTTEDINTLLSNQ